MPLRKVYGKPCVQKDAFNDLVPKIKAADCIVFASPMYFWTFADDFFWTFEQAVSYYKFAVVNYIGFHDKGMILAGGCGDTNGAPHIAETNHLQEAYEFGTQYLPVDSMQTSWQLLSSSHCLNSRIELL